MANWTNEPQPFGANHAPLLTGLASDGSGPVPVAVDKTTGGIITTVNGVTGTKSNNGGAPGSTNLGVLPAVANAANPSYTEGNQIALSTDLAGNLRVTGSLSVGGTTDNSAFTAGTSTGTPAMGFYHSTIDAVTDGRSAVHAITSFRAGHVNLRNASGTEIGTSSNPVQVSLANTAANATAVKVDGSAIIQPVSLTSTTITGTVAVTESGTWTVNNNDGAGNALTSNSTTYTAKHALDGNLLGTLGTAFTTAGKVDVKGADGDVFVRQATASNLNATVVGTGTFAVQAALNAETTKVIGVTRTADGSGNLLTSTGNALDVNLKTSSITLPVSGTVTANPTVPTAVKYGQATVSVTNTAVQLTNQALSGNGGVIIQALAGNAGNIVIGDSSVTTGNGFQLQPGQAAGVNVDNVNRLYVNGTSGDGVCWIGS